MTKMCPLTPESGLFVVLFLLARHGRTICTICTSTCCVIDQLLMCLRADATQKNFQNSPTPCTNSDSHNGSKNVSGGFKHDKITSEYQNKTLLTCGEKIKLFPFLLKKKKEKDYWTKHIIADSLPYRSTVIMPIKHILYINNNRQLKWVLCQGVLVTQCAKGAHPMRFGLLWVWLQRFKASHKAQNWTERQQPAKALTNMLAVADES